MPVYTSSAVRPRAELAVTIVEAGAINQLNIWSKVLPLYGINKRNAHIVKATIADSAALRILTDKFLRAPGTKFERLVAKFGDATFDVDIRGAEIVVPYETSMDYADFLDVESFFTRRFGRQADDTHEFLASAALFNTTTFGAATNSAVAYTAANLATMTPVADILASIRRVKAKGEQPDTVVIAGPVYERIRLSTEMKNFVIGQLGAGSEVTANTLQRALADQGIKQVLIGDAYYNTAVDGATPVLTQIWANTYIWVGRSGTAVNDNTQEGTVGDLVGAGAMMYWEDYTPESGVMVESYPDQTIDSNIIRVKMSSKPFIGNARAGDLIATQYA